MKQTYFLISILLLVANLSLSNSFAQDYIHYATLTGHTDGFFDICAVTSVAFSPDGQTLAGGSRDGSIWLWDVATGKHRKTLTGCENTIHGLSFSPDGLTLATWSFHAVCLWDVTTGKHKTTLRGHTGSVYEVSFSPDGLTLASGGEDKTIRLWDVATGQHKKTLTGHTDSLYDVAFSLNRS